MTFESILAHGFKCVSQLVQTRIWYFACQSEIDIHVMFWIFYVRVRIRKSKHRQFCKFEEINHFAYCFVSFMLYLLNYWRKLFLSILGQALPKKVKLDQTRKRLIAFMSWKSPDLKSVIWHRSLWIFRLVKQSAGDISAICLKPALKLSDKN